MKIAPSILSADFGDLRADTKRLQAAGADWIHIDMMDGAFVPNISFGAPIMQAIRDATDLTFDCHMMIEAPERYIDMMAAAGADVISVHVEATPHIHRALQQIHGHGLKAGVVINPGTPVSAIEPILGEVDLVLVMSVNPGFGGQAFIPQSLEKIQQLSDLRRAKDYSYLIEVDGGINDQTAAACASAGADVLVAGSYVFNAPDLSLAIQSLRSDQEVK